MKLSTGVIGFPIEFDNGDKQIIYFNPNDLELFVRLKKFENGLSKRINQIKDIELNNDGSAVNDAEAQLVEKLMQAIKEEVDYAFNSSISNVVFKYCSPLAVVNGEFYVEAFLTALTPEIKREIEKSNKKLEKHIGKYKI